MLKVTVQNKEAINKCRDQVRDIAMSEKENITKSIAQDMAAGTTKLNMSDHHAVCEQLRYVLFHHALGDAFRYLSFACALLDQTDEDLAAKCAEHGETVQEAFRNAMVNMMTDTIITELHR